VLGGAIVVVVGVAIGAPCASSCGGSLTDS
jgi:hypothetical protein